MMKEDTSVRCQNCGKETGYKTRHSVDPYVGLTVKDSCDCGGEYRVTEVHQ